MTASSSLPAPTLLPLMRYRDLGAALDWLESAFGFERQVAVSDTDGAIIYAQMTYGPSMLMLGAVRETDLDGLLRQPDEVGGVVTQSCYVVVEDADAHHARALASGADVVLPLKSDGLGRRGYSCRDPQGHLWSFGTYSPAKPLPTTEDESARPAARAWPRKLGFAASLVGACAMGWWLHASAMVGSVAGLAKREAAAPVSADAGRVAAKDLEMEQALSDARRALDDARRERQAALAQAEAARTEAARLGRDNADAVKTIASLREDLARETARQQPAAPATSAAAEPPAPAAAKDAPAAQAAMVAARPEPVPEPAKPTASAEPQMQAEASKLETSSAKEALPAKGDKPEVRPQAAVRAKKPATANDGRRKPSYVVEMSSVPWPYSTWYK